METVREDTESSTMGDPSNNPEQILQTDPENNPENNCGTDQTDFVLFFNKDRSLLEYCRGSSLSTDLLDRILRHRKSLGLDQCESIDQVDKAGFGAIHYIVKKDSHKNKHGLLERLIINGEADVDLTTTFRDGVTGLHLAVEKSDLECVKTLISLDADINKADRLGKTPLDMNHLRHASGTGLQLTSLKDNDTPSMEASIEVKEISKKEQESEDTAKEIKELLKSVGAHSSDSKPTALGTSASNVSLKKYDTSPSFNFRKINTQYYREAHDKVWTKLRNECYTFKPKEAGELVELMQQQELYRTKCGSRILCLDGGGIRGLIQMAVLREIERLTEKRIIDLFDWIVGTSTGGIIALALTYGPQADNVNVVGQKIGRKTVRQMRDLYWAMKDDIFGESWDGFLGFLAKGNTKKLEEYLQEWLGSDVVLSDETYPKLLIPAVSKKDANLDLHFFNNCFGDEYSKELIWKVARYTSAAPFYFKEFENYIDGGILANNPSEAALTTIQDYYHRRGEKIPISLLVSVGTGCNPGSPLGEIDIKTNFLNPKAYLGLMEVLESAVLNRATHTSCQSRCREQGIDYFRFNPNLKKKVDSDQHDSLVLRDMIITTRQYLKDREGDINKLAQLLKASELTST